MSPVKVEFRKGRLNLRMEKAMKINLDSPVIVFNYSCRFYDVKYSVHFMLCAGHYDRRQSVPFTRLLCARQDMRVDIYSNLFQSI